MLKIENDVRSYGINIPTSLEEITPEYFEKLFKNIKVAKNYCIVALCNCETLFSCVSNYKNKTNGYSSVIPIIAVPNGYDANVCDRISIEPSSLERALHINVPNNVIGYNFVGNYCNEDKNLTEAILKGTFFNNGKHTGAELAKRNAPNCYFVEFKIVPFVDIKATYSMKDNFDCIYKVPKAELN